MKKRISFLLIIGFAFALTSCESFLTEDPKGRLVPDMLFKDANGLDLAVTGMYNQFTESFRCAICQPYVWCGDDVTALYWNSTLMDFDRFYFYSLSTYIIELWRSLYASIKAANHIINQGEMMDYNRTFIEQSVGQAYIIRAFNYFQLVRVFGRIPLVTQVEIDYTTPRASIEDIYALIEADLAKAEAYLPINHTVAPYFNNGINIAPGKGAAKAMLASVWMTQAGWPLKKGTAFYDRAAAKYREIIDDEAMYGYMLEPDIRTLTMHPDGNFIKEIVWGGFLNQKDGYASAYSEVPQESSGWGLIIPELEYYYSFPDGRRKEAFFMKKVFVNIWANGYCVDWWDLETRQLHPYFKKNIHRTEWTSYDYETGEWNISGIGEHGKTRYLFRYADILLLYAEAVAFGSGFENAASKALAYNCVRRVQDRAEVPEDRKIKDGMTKEEFQQAVLDERRWETGGMEMSVMARFFTMQRHEILHLQSQYRIWDPSDPNRWKIPVTTIYDPGLNPNLTLSDEFYYLPIPFIERQIVPDL